MGLTGKAVSVSSPTVSPEALGSAGLGTRRSPVPTIKMVLRRAASRALLAVIRGARFVVAGALVLGGILSMRALLVSMGQRAGRASSW